LVFLFFFELLESLLFSTEACGGCRLSFETDRAHDQAVKANATR